VSKLIWDLAGGWESLALAVAPQEAVEPVLVLLQVVCSSVSQGTSAASYVACLSVCVTPDLIVPCS